MSAQCHKAGLTCEHSLTLYCKPLCRGIKQPKKLATHELGLPVGPMLLWWLHASLLQVALTRQGMPAKALQAVRMLLASEQLHSQRSAADFAKQIDPLHEESCLQVLPIAADDLNISNHPHFSSLSHLYSTV